MPYPLSSSVSSGQPTLAAHYNNLRSDALYNGNLAADSNPLGALLATYAANISFQKLSLSRIRIPYDASRPPTLVIDGCMLKATANIDLPGGLIVSTGTWYIIASHVAGSTTFAITANSSPSLAAGQILLGEVYFDGSTIGLMKVYVNSVSRFPDPDYDSGWFAVNSAGTYTRSHALGDQPSLVTLVYAASAGGTPVVPVTIVYAVTPAGSVYDPIYYDATNIVVKTGDSSSYDAVVHSRIAQANTGYYRIRAWK